MTRKIPKQQKFNGRIRLMLTAALAVALVLASVGISAATHDANSSVMQAMKRINPIALAHHLLAV